MTASPPGPPPDDGVDNTADGANNTDGAGDTASHAPAPRRTRAPAIVFSLAGLALVALAGVLVLSLVTNHEGGGGASGGGRGTAAPSTESTPPDTRAIGDKPLMRDPDAGLQAHPCSLPPWQNDKAGAQRFFTAATECLNRAWEPFLRQFDLPFRKPALHFPDGPAFRTPCGNIQVDVTTAAYYCNDNLYVPFDGLQTDHYGDQPGIYLSVIAHEYGHHVQEVAGIMDAVWARINTVGERSDEGQDLSRRRELQAQCFSGMFLGSHTGRSGERGVTQDMFDTAWYDQDTRGDDTSGTSDHGSNANYAHWWRAGAESNRIVDCDTFSAKPSAVS